MLDHLAAHKIAGVRQAIAAASASVLYLPPYWPDLNPIEQLFAKLKVRTPVSHRDPASGP